MEGMHAWTCRLEGKANKVSQDYMQCGKLVHHDHGGAGLMRGCAQEKGWRVIEVVKRRKARRGHQASRGGPSSDTKW